ncbi:MAG: dTDP-4-amino-4,6-dideoxygalactose transaminase [Bacteroidia bacterium]|jgi:dTDP-4-amino-4,6-dideoxygalactose transaminase
MNVKFNQPYTTGNELKYLEKAISFGHLSGNGEFTKKSQDLLKRHSAVRQCLLTTSCTDALEMSSLLAEVKQGDEVIIPAYTFVSTANAFAMRGAKIVLVDSRPDHPGMDENQLESLINNRTKAIVPVHYAGVACDMEKIMALARQFNLMVVEDAAQAIDATFTWKNSNVSALGSIGHLGAYSFHETKNIQCGEGGALLVNDPSLIDRAEIIIENGTNRISFMKGEVDKYDWMEIGSSFMPSELTAAFLYAQLQKINEIQSLRMNIWNQYFHGFTSLIKSGKVRGPHIPEYASNNAHMFYLVCNNAKERTDLINHLRNLGINPAFHYQSLHNSPYFKLKNNNRPFPEAEKYTDQLVRMPLHPQLSADQVSYVIDQVHQYYSR